MENLSVVNKLNIFDQNFRHFMKIKQRYKKLKSHDIEQIKYELHFKAQSQLSYAIPRCVLHRIDVTNLMNPLNIIHPNSQHHISNTNLSIQNSSSDDDNFLLESPLILSNIQVQPPIIIIDNNNTNNEILPLTESYELTKSVAICDENNQENLVTFTISAQLPPPIDTTISNCNIDTSSLSKINQILPSDADVSDNVIETNNHDHEIDILDSILKTNDTIDPQNNTWNTQNIENIDLSDDNDIIKDSKNSDNSLISPLLETILFDDQPVEEKRNIRPRKPVLYTENLSHIHFGGSSGGSSSKKRAATSKTITSKTSTPTTSKVRKISAMSQVTSTVMSSSQHEHEHEHEHENVTENKTDTPKIFSGTALINNNSKIECGHILEIKQLPKNATRSIVEINMPKSITNTISMHPCRISVNLGTIDTSDLLGYQDGSFQENVISAYYNKETEAAVATITGNNLTPCIAPTIAPPPIISKPKRVCKPRTRKTEGTTKSSKNKQNKKSDLAKYIESFGQTSSNTVDQNNYYNSLAANNHNNNQYVQIPNQSPQNAGISTTTTTDFHPTNNLDDGGSCVITQNADGAWTVQPLANSTFYNSTQQTIDPQLLNTSQLDAEFENENNVFNIINYIEDDDGGTLLSNSKSNVTTNHLSNDNNNRNQSFENSNSKYVSSSLDLNMFSQKPPQLVVGNFYERSLTCKNFTTAPVHNGYEQRISLNENQLVKAHASTESRLYKLTSPDITRNKSDVLDLSYKPPLPNRAAAAYENDVNNSSCMSDNIEPRFPKKRSITFEDYKNRQIDNTIQTSKSGVKGPDMPILYTENLDDKSFNCLANDLNTLETDESKSEIVIKSQNSPSQTITTESSSVVVNEIPAEAKSKFKMDEKLLIKISPGNKREVQSFQSNISSTECISKNINNYENDNKFTNENHEILNGETSCSNDLNEKSMNYPVQSNSIESSDTDPKKYFDDFLSMKDNNELDYDDEDDCLKLYSSPFHIFEDEDTENFSNIKEELNLLPDNNNINTKNKVIRKSIEKNNNSNNDNENKTTTTTTTDILDVHHKCKSSTLSTTTTTNTIQSLFNTNNLLKMDYKIPKITIKTCVSPPSTCSNTTITTTSGTSYSNLSIRRNSILNFDENSDNKITTNTNKLRCWPNNPTNILKPYATNDDLQQYNNSNNSKLSSISPLIPSAISSIIKCNNNHQFQSLSTENNNIIYNKKCKISRIFDSPCFNFLEDKCFENICRYRHTFLRPEEIKSRLKFQHCNVTIAAYNFSMRFYKLYRIYFEIFCEIFTEKKCRLMLMNNLIIDCQKLQNSPQFLRYIVNGLMKNGYSKVETIQAIINKSDNSTGTINIIIELIIETSPLIFFKNLEYYSNLNEYTFQKSSIKKLAEFCIQNNCRELTLLLSKIIHRLPRTNWDGDLIIMEFFKFSSQNNLNIIFNDILNNPNNATTTINGLQQQVTQVQSIIRSVQQNNDNLQMTLTHRPVDFLVSSLQESEGQQQNLHHQQQHKALIGLLQSTLNQSNS